MTSQHTPTPWTHLLGEDGDVIAIVNDASTLSGRKTIVRPGTPGFDSSLTTEQNNANAAFIVRAVNNFDPMLATLKQVQYGLELRAYAESKNIGLKQDLEAVNAAIAKAEGK